MRVFYMENHHKKRTRGSSPIPFKLSDKKIDTGSRLWPTGKYSYDEEDVREFIRRLKELDNAEGGYNCQCVDGSMVEGGKGYTCDFCLALSKLAGEKLI